MPLFARRGDQLVAAPRPCPARRGKDRHQAPNLLGRPAACGVPWSPGGRVFDPLSVVIRRSRVISKPISSGNLLEECAKKPWVERSFLPHMRQLVQDQRVIDDEQVRGYFGKDLQIGGIGGSARGRARRIGPGAGGAVAGCRGAPARGRAWPGRSITKPGRAAPASGRDREGLPQAECRTTAGRAGVRPFSRALVRHGGLASSMVFVDPRGERSPCRRSRRNLLRGPPRRPAMGGRGLFLTLVAR